MYCSNFHPRPRVVGYRIFCVVCTTANCNHIVALPTLGYLCLHAVLSFLPPSHVSGNSYCSTSSSSTVVVVVVAVVGRWPLTVRAGLGRVSYGVEGLHACLGASKMERMDCCLVDAGVRAMFEVHTTSEICVGSSIRA